MWCGHGDRLPAGACLPGHNDEVFRSGTPFVTVDGGAGEGGPTDGPVMARFRNSPAARGRNRTVS